MEERSVLEGIRNVSDEASARQFVAQCFSYYLRTGYPEIQFYERIGIAQPEFDRPVDPDFDQQMAHQREEWEMKVRLVLDMFETLCAEGLVRHGPFSERSPGKNSRGLWFSLTWKGERALEDGMF